MDLRSARETYYRYVGQLKIREQLMGWFDARRKIDANTHELLVKRFHG